MSTTTHDVLSPARRAPRRRSSGALRALLGTEARLFLREPLGLFWCVGLPLIILVVIGATAGDDPQKDLGGLRTIDAYVPIMAVFSLCMIALNALPPTLAGRRERGVLRRMATTPVSPARLLLAQVLVHGALAVASVLLVVAVGRVAFDVPLPDPLGGFALIVLVAGAAMLCLGLLVAAVAPTTRAANALGSILFFPAMFLGGLWLPREAMSDVLRHVSDATPVGAAVGALQDVTTNGSWPSLGALAVIAAWGLGGALLARRLFRWE